jgi:ketol-acid reductoisomerase
MSDDEFTTPVYYQSDADQSHLDDKTVAVLGYGSQGHAHSLNLSESGVDVVVGLREDSSSREAAEEEGLTVKDPLEATRDGDFIMFLVPDTVAPTVYEAVSPGIEAGDTVMFAHGFNIHYSQIEPQDDVDVTMVAPKSPGHLVRRNYVNDQGTPALIAIEQDVSGDAHAEALAYADALGCARAGVIETSFQEEVESDLFGEQAVLCGGVTALVKLGFETLVDNGYAPEMAYFECLNELKLIVDLMYEGGLGEMWHSVSDTAEYGGLSQGEDILDENVRENMEETLEAVQNGEFAREWITENQAGRPSYNQLVEAEENHQIEDVGERLRALFSWSEEAAPADD